MFPPCVVREPLFPRVPRGGFRLRADPLSQRGYFGYCLCGCGGMRFRLRAYGASSTFIRRLEKCNRGSKRQSAENAVKGEGSAAHTARCIRPVTAPVTQSDTPQDYYLG